MTPNEMTPEQAREYFPGRLANYEASAGMHARACGRRIAVVWRGGFDLADAHDAEQAGETLLFVGDPQARPAPTPKMRQRVVPCDDDEPEVKPRKRQKKA